MKLRKLNDVYCISILDLETLGFKLPLVGTKVYYLKSLFITGDWDVACSVEWSRFSGYKEGWDTVELSPYCNDIGRKSLGKSEVYIPFNSETFQMIEDKSYKNWKEKNNEYAK